MRIVWSPRSLRDLQAIHEYIAKDSELYGNLTIARIFAAAERLPRFRTPGALFRRWMNRRFEKSSLDRFALCIAFGRN